MSLIGRNYYNPLKCSQIKKHKFVSYISNRNNVINSNNVVLFSEIYIGK